MIEVFVLLLCVNVMVGMKYQLFEIMSVVCCLMSNPVTAASNNLCARKIGKITGKFILYWYLDDGDLGHKIRCCNLYLQLCCQWFYLSGDMYAMSS